MPENISPDFELHRQADFFVKDEENAVYVPFYGFERMSVWLIFSAFASSLQSHRESLRRNFVPIPSGHRETIWTCHIAHQKWTTMRVFCCDRSLQLITHLLMIPIPGSYKILQRPRRDIRRKSDRLKALTLKIRKLTANNGFQIGPRLASPKTIIKLW